MWGNDHIGGYSSEAFEALEAGVEAITDPSSDTYAAARGTATLTVGGDVKAETSENRVVYKRKGKEDKAIIGGGEAAKATVERAIREMNQAAERIGKDIESGALDPTDENLKARAEEELKKWGESLGGSRRT